jgi:5-dehydro-2-deoxygluconokinase
VSDVSASEEPVLFLALDHRNSVERDLYKLTSPSPDTEATEARITADKLLVYQALLDAIPQLPKGVRPGILIDEEYGASVAELAGRAKDEVSLAMPIEASGKVWLEFAYGEDWARHAEFFATDYSKVLVRDNPGFDPAQRAQQASRLAEISKWATASGRSLLIELIVPATAAENQAAGSERAYDDGRRPADTVAVIEYLQDRGVDPAIWKVEGLDEHDDAVKILETAQRGGRTAHCIVLGRHASQEDVDRWLRVSAPIPGWVGFAIGRTIWWDALDSHLHGRATRRETRERIGRSYLNFARYYVKARDGGPTEP